MSKKELTNPTKEQQAVQILIQVANLAQSKGILTLEDASVVLGAVKHLEDICLKEEEPKQEPKAYPNPEPIQKE